MSVVYGSDRRSVKWKVVRLESQLLVFTSTGDLVEKKTFFFPFLDAL